MLRDAVEKFYQNFSVEKYPEDEAPRRLEGRFSTNSKHQKTQRFEKFQLPRTFFIPGQQRSKKLSHFQRMEILQKRFTSAISIILKANELLSGLVLI